MPSLLAGDFGGLEIFLFLPGDLLEPPERHHDHGDAQQNPKESKPVRAQPSRAQTSKTKRDENVSSTTAAPIDTSQRTVPRHRQRYSQTSTQDTCASQDYYKQGRIVNLYFLWRRPRPRADGPTPQRCSQNYHRRHRPRKWSSGNQALYYYVEIIEETNACGRKRARTSAREATRVRVRADPDTNTQVSYHHDHPRLTFRTIIQSTIRTSADKPRMTDRTQTRIATNRRTRN